jgi:hypothetical protein
MNRIAKITLAWFVLTCGGVTAGEVVGHQSVETVSSIEAVLSNPTHYQEPEGSALVRGKVQSVRPLKKEELEPFLSTGPGMTIKLQDETGEIEIFFIDSCGRRGVCDLQSQFDEYPRLEREIKAGRMITVRGSTEVLRGGGNVERVIVVGDSFILQRE